ncbi:hypothetical protein CPC08DRAFT_771651 [Agrocybe pediades]|nr:hypothetical protein CPC08DRAFT_771651 [Agrocybe pediades]
MTTNTHSNKAGNPPGTGKSGPATRSHDAHITSEKEALTHLKNSTILGEDDSHSTIQGIAAALRRYAGLIKPANSLGALDIRKTMSSLALLLELADPKDKESAADQLKDAVTRAVDEAKEELKKTVQEEMAKMRTIAEATNTTVTENLAGLQNASTSQPAKPSYSSIAAGAISADARLVAQRAIQDRQVLLKIDPDDTNGGALRYEMDIPSTKKTLQSEIDKLNPKYKIRLVQKTRERGILIEMASEEGAEWLRTSMKNSELARTLGATVKDRQHHVLVKFVPITFDETKEMQDVLDDNDIDPKFYIKARWIKPVHRRRPEQRFGHMGNHHTLPEARRGTPQGRTNKMPQVSPLWPHCKELHRGRRHMRHLRRDWTPNECMHDQRPKVLRVMSKRRPQQLGQRLPGISTEVRRIRQATPREHPALFPFDRALDMGTGRHT